MVGMWRLVVLLLAGLGRALPEDEGEAGAGAGLGPGRTGRWVRSFRRDRD